MRTCLRAIAYMLCVKGMDYSWPYEPVVETAYPHGSYAAVLGHADVAAEVEAFELPRTMRLN